MKDELKQQLDEVLGRHGDAKVNPDRKTMIGDAVARREAMVAACGCLAVWTPPESTGRSPQDTVIVRRPESEMNIDWDAPNNLPLTPETRHLLDRDRIRLMRPGAYLLNLGRGALWDERAVLEALEAGWIAGAGSDVFEQEPAAPTHPLFRHRNFVCTPHMSAHTEEAMRRMSLVAEDVLAVLDGREPRWPANRLSRG